MVFTDNLIFWVIFFTPYCNPIDLFIHPGFWWPRSEVISMLVDPNLNSPANIDAAVNMKNDYDAWKKKATTNRPTGRSTMGLSWVNNDQLILMRLNDEWDYKIDND